MIYDEHGTHIKKPCDCLNDCGDDSNLHNGLVLPCAWRQKSIDSAKRKKEEKEQLLNDLVDLQKRVKLTTDKQTILIAINHIKGR